MKDVAGNELFIGDKVVTNTTGYKDLTVMFVVGYTPKGVKLAKTKGGEYYGCNRTSSYVAKLFNQNV